MTAPSLLELEFHGVGCRAELHDGLLEGPLRELFGHAIGSGPDAELVITVRESSSTPERPEKPPLPMIADELVWGDLKDGQLVLSDDRSVARIDYAKCRASLELSDRSYAAEFVATHRLFPIALAELLRTRGVYYLHAAAVATSEGAVVFAADSEAGKSTLAYCAMRDGMKYIADDGILLTIAQDGTTFVEPCYRKFALEKHVMTPEDRARAVPFEIVPIGDTRSRIVPDEARCSRRAPVKAFLSLARTSGPSKVEDSSRAEVLGELLRQNSLAALEPSLAASHLSALCQMLKGARVGVIHSGPDVIETAGTAGALLRAFAGSRAG